MKNKTRRLLKKKVDCYKLVIRKHIFNDCFYNRGLEETCRRIELHRGVIIKYINYLDYDMRRLYRENGMTYKPDNRSGEEAYGYDSIEEIEDNLSYISDRFACEFRLRGMLEIPKKFKKLLASQAPPC